ncbi:MAG TPA: flagellar hook-length control protein FliK [Candidatus Eisenbacteria bacterium]|nr:flagellar hook-length control protein FliK [Candidatus Eisenbacteria bacterium]
MNVVPASLGAIGAIGVDAAAPPGVAGPGFDFTSLLVALLGRPAEVVAPPVAADGDVAAPEEMTSGEGEAPEVARPAEEDGQPIAATMLAAAAAAATPVVAVPIATAPAVESADLPRPQSPSLLPAAVPGEDAKRPAAPVRSTDEVPPAPANVATLAPRPPDVDAILGATATPTATPPAKPVVDAVPAPVDDAPVVVPSGSAPDAPEPAVVPSSPVLAQAIPAAAATPGTVVGTAPVSAPATEAAPIAAKAPIAIASATRIPSSDSEEKPASGPAAARAPAKPLAHESTAAASAVVETPAAQGAVDRGRREPQEQVAREAKAPAASPANPSSPASGHEMAPRRVERAEARADVDAPALERPTPQHTEPAVTAAPAAPRPEHAPAPPARDAAPAPSVDVDRLLAAHEARPARMHDDGAMRLQVEHEKLGPIDVRVAVRDHGVHADLLASHGDAREALVTNRPSLEAALGRANLRLEGFTVGLGQHHDPQHAPGREPQPALPAAPASERLSPPSIATAEPAPVVTTAGRLSLRA